LAPDSTAAVGLQKLGHLLRVHPVLSLETLSTTLESHPSVKAMLASAGSVAQEPMKVLLCDYAAAVARVNLTAAVQLLYTLAVGASQGTCKMSRQLLLALLDACRSAVSPHLTAASAFKTGCHLAATLASAPGHGQALHALTAALEHQSACTDQAGDTAAVTLTLMLAVCNAAQCKAAAEQVQALITTLQQPLSRDAMHAMVTQQVRHPHAINIFSIKVVALQKCCSTQDCLCERGISLQVCLSSQQQAGLSAALVELHRDLVGSTDSIAVLSSLSKVQQEVSSCDRLKPLATAILQLSSILQAADQVCMVLAGSVMPSPALLFEPRTALLKILATIFCTADSDKVPAVMAMCQCLVAALGVQAAAALPEGTDAVGGAARMSSLGLVIGLMQAFTHPAGLMCAMEAPVLPAGILYDNLHAIASRSAVLNLER